MVKTSYIFFKYVFRTMKFTKKNCWDNKFGSLYLFAYFDCKLEKSQGWKDLKKSTFTSGQSSGKIELSWRIIPELSETSYFLLVLSIYLLFFRLTSSYFFVWGGINLLFFSLTSSPIFWKNGLSKQITQNKFCNYIITKLRNYYVIMQ